MLESIKNLSLYRAARVLYHNFKLRKAQQAMLKSYEKDLQDFERSEQKSQIRFNRAYHRYPALGDKTKNTDFEPHYTYHPAWAARVLAATLPKKHIDISSTLNFCTIVSAFVPVEFYDFRPANVILSNLKSSKGNLLALPFDDNSVESLSCMHTIEHIGLGRYGDVIDYDGDIKAMAELTRVLAPDGNLLIVVPMGKSRIEFNAHRIYGYEQIASYFSSLKLMEFSLVPDEFESVGLLKNPDVAIADAQNWGCGCFWFKKLKSHE